jgi:AraC family transcriptional regulator
MAGPRYASYADWYSQGPLAPYVRACSMAGEAISIIEARQPPGDMSDPPVNELVLMRSVSIGIPFEFDLGAGRFSGLESHGDFHLVAPNTQSDIQVHAPHATELFSLPAKHCQDLLGGDCPPGLDFGELHRRLFRSELLNALCQRLIESVRSPHPQSRLFADGAAMAMLAELALLGGQPRAHHRRTDVRDWRIRRAIERIDAHLDEDIGLAELAEGVGLSPSRLNTLFRAATGLAPHAWLIRRRIERARELLLDRGRSITDIAHALGFSSSQHFATSFRTQTGVTPTAWRNDRCS